MAALDKSTKKQRNSTVDVSAAQVSDVNISGVSSTPVSDAAESTTTRRTRRNVASMPSLSEIPPPPAEILPPILDNNEPLLPTMVTDDQLVQVSSSGEDNVVASGSHEAMVGPDIIEPNYKSILGYDNDLRYVIYTFFYYVWQQMLDI